MSSPPSISSPPFYPSSSHKRRISITGSLPPPAAKKPKIPPPRKLSTFAPPSSHPLRQTSFPPDPPPPGAKEDEEDDDAREDDYGTSTVLAEGATGNFGGEDDEKIKLSVLLDSFDSQQTQRYEAFRRANLNKAAVKRLANQVLSQSVTAGVGTAICGFSKVFTGEIVELALKVQKEWADADVEGEGIENIRKRTKSDGSLGPLLPDHLREAARRYRLELRGAVGFRGSIGGGCGNTLGAGPGAGGEGAIGGVGRLFR
ncbi:hTAFII28-like protein conserved region-domain-containing protein [Tuber brumale]|nr:hTAFII28-like protein conserved region-domain-containing protein [Tuber brumale]